LYLLAVAVGIFFLHPLWQVAAVLGLQMVLWLAVGLPPRRLVRQTFKLWGFALFLVLSYALARSDEGAPEQWVRWHWLKINVAGALTGATMVLRVMAVVLASQVARAGDVRAIAAGLAKLRVPRMVAAPIDAVLALLGGAGGGGGGGGGGHRHEQPEGPREGFLTAVKRLGRGDVAPLIGRLESQIARAEKHVATQFGRHPWVRDVALIAGISLTMLGFKAIKILPSIPFAPGYKLVILTPFYILASLLTRTRVGATLAGLTMGTVAFLMGDGRYGIFEIAKHVAPGVVSDLGVPLLVRGGRQPGPLSWSLLGTLMAVGRMATIFCIVLTVQAPRVAYALLLPGLAFQCTFGALSGYVSYQLVRAAGPLGAPRSAGGKDEEAALRRAEGKT